MIYLDTHVVLWLYEGLLDQLPLLSKRYIEENEIFISPIVELELQYLFEIQRIKRESKVIVAELVNAIALKICADPFQKIVQAALPMQWTRDPFDRLIVAAAKNKNAVLITKDQHIKENYDRATWG